MSSDEARMAQTLSRRGLLRGLSLLLASMPALSACGNGGFRPLYGTTASGAGMQERLAQIDYAPIPGRVGQRIRNELIFESTGGGNPLPPSHRLEVVVKESVLSTLVTNEGEALGQIYAIQASFRLIDIKSKDKKVVLQGTSHARAGYERFQSIYSNVRAREDAENRAARTVADDLKTRLAAYLSGAA
jgi:LPS-assembly lipoprotein